VPRSLCFTAVCCSFGRFRKGVLIFIPLAIYRQMSSKNNKNGRQMGDKKWAITFVSLWHEVLLVEGSHLNKKELNQL